MVLTLGPCCFPWPVKAFVSMSHTGLTLVFWFVFCYGTQVYLLCFRIYFCSAILFRALFYLLSHRYSVLFSCSSSMGWLLRHVCAGPPMRL